MCIEGVNQKCNNGRLNSQNNLTKALKTERKEQDNPNQKLSEKLLSITYRCNKMSLNISEVIQDELERLESQKNQNQNAQAAEQAAQA